MRSSFSHLTILFLLARASLSRAESESPPIQWGPCDPSVVSNPSLSCGFFDIPLDYHDPSAGQGKLAVIKANATGQRRGTVFFNPGGPGGSGLDSLDVDADVLVNLTGGVYDVVSWDPRGVGSLTVYVPFALRAPVTPARLCLAWLMCPQ